MRVTKSDVEGILRCKIDDGLFQRALKEARQKQKYIYSVEHRAVVLQHWYLVKLTEEMSGFWILQNGQMICAKCAIWKKSTRQIVRAPNRITIL